MLILGINAYHGDVSAALVRDGQLVAAVEEERFRRIKHCAGFPDRRDSRVPGDGRRRGGGRRRVRRVARSARASAGARRCSLLRNRPSGDCRAIARATIASIARAAADRSRPRSASTSARRAPRLHCVEHHPAHLASAASSRPFDEAAVCAIDGFGDFVSTSWGRVAGSRLTIDGASTFRIRSACCISRSPSTSASRSTATSSR